MSRLRSYSGLIRLTSFEDRFNYLKLNGIVGKETFGFDRYLNQKFYRSSDWRRVKREVILRDNGCDLAVKDRPISGSIFVHHINPISIEDIANNSDYILDPEFLVCVSKRTHDAIHYSDESILLINDVTERKEGDTCLWR